MSKKKDKKEKTQNAVAMHRSNPVACAGAVHGIADLLEPFNPDDRERILAAVDALVCSNAERSGS